MYGLDEFRTKNLMRLRKIMNKTLAGELPVLEEVARYLDELPIMEVPLREKGAHLLSNTLMG